ncbi:hypothetical protein I6A84_03210 [Frankia sp. CNm7]|uniref:Uncharacterized protein n=1 Tax=Frankia nepalensis TaxID=1836974 RepID=A0A937RCN1_9ACTN|nr:WD40 repeat domain-containing protein [Frankia nepalensis]MBL7501443.1 hypothetical protein [Frankia nepalensis]MBL7509994.1 hypothetical protein [Frankia nepalensis]MBL7517156.1 hypothetical protein [Frankia nepalensis]MBL7627995.1 hypothetical protein [Frankia nepalensis]
MTATDSRPFPPGDDRTTPAADLSDLTGLHDRLVGAEQRWLELVAAARRAGAGALQALLPPSGESYAALAQSWDGPGPRGGESEPDDEAALLEPESPEASPDLSAARALLAVALGTVDHHRAEDCLQEAARRWALANLPAVDSGLPFPKALLAGPGAEALPFFAAAQATTGPYRGLLALAAARVLDQQPPVRRRLGLTVQVRLPVLFDRNVEGGTGVLHLRILDGGPAGLHPDPSTMAFFHGDEAFVTAARDAWTSSPLAEAGECVVWSVLDGDTPCNAIQQGSLGGAFAVALHELHRCRQPLRRLSPWRLRARCAVTGAIDSAGDELLSVDGYNRKIPAARDAKLRRVVVPKTSLDRGDVPKDDDLEILGAQNVRQAIQKARGLNRVLAAGLAVVLAILAVSGALIARSWSHEQDARAQADLERRRAAAEQLVGRADRVQENDPRLALRLGIAAQALDPATDYGSLLLETLASNPLSSSLEGDTWATVTDDGDYAITAAGESLQVWDVRDPTRPRRASSFTPSGDDPFLNRAMLAPDGNTLAIPVRTTGRFASSYQVTLWDLTSKSAPRALGAPFGHMSCLGALPLTSLAFSGDGRLLALAGDDGAVLWDVSDRAAPRQLGAPIPSQCTVALSADGRRLVANDDVLRLWDVSTPASPRLLDSVERTGSGFDPEYNADGGMWLSPDGTRLVVANRTLADTGAGGGRIGSADPPDLDDTKLWWFGIYNGSSLTFNAELSGADTPVLFTGDGALLTESDDHGIFLWNMSGGPERVNQEPLTGHVDGAQSMALSTKENVLVTADGDGVLLWRLDSWRVPRLGAPFAGGQGLVFSPDGETVLDEDGVLWDIRTAAAPKRRAGGLPASRERDSVDFSRDGGRLAISSDGQVTVWDVQGGARPSRIDSLPTGEADGSVLFSPDGKRIVVRFEREAIVWEPGIPGSSPRVVGLEGRETEAETFRAGDLLYVADRFWEVTDQPGSGALRPVGGPTGVRSCSQGGGCVPPAVVPYSRGKDAGLLEIRDQRVYIWLLDSARTLQKVGSLPLPEGPYPRVDSSADGSLVAVSGDSYRIELWDLSDPRSPRGLGAPLPGHVSYPTVAFSPDNGLMISSGRDFTIIWDIGNPASPRRLGPPLHRAGDPTHVEFSASGDVFFLSGVYTVAWDLSALNELRADPLPRACVAAGGGLTEDEWRLYAGDLPYQRTCDE